MIIWDDEKNKKLIKTRNLSFEDILPIILNKQYLDILENSKRAGQMIFVIDYKNYTYVVPFMVDKNNSIILKTIYPSRKFHKIYGGGKNG